MFRMPRPSVITDENPHQDPARGIRRPGGTASGSAAGDTVDQQCRAGLDANHIPYATPDAAILVGHRVADYLTKTPTMAEVGLVANKVITDSAEQGIDVSVHQAVALIHLAVHYYAPPWVEPTLDQLAGP